VLRLRIEYGSRWVERRAGSVVRDVHSITARDDDFPRRVQLFSEEGRHDRSPREAGAPCPCMWPAGDADAPPPCEESASRAVQTALARPGAARGWWWRRAGHGAPPVPSESDAADELDVPLPRMGPAVLATRGCPVALSPRPVTGKSKQNGNRFDSRRGLARA